MNKTRPDGKPHPDAFWTLEGYTDSYKAIRGPLDALLKKWEPKVRRQNALPSSRLCGQPPPHPLLANTPFGIRTHQHTPPIHLHTYTSHTSHTHNTPHTQDAHTPPHTTPPRPQLPAGYKVWYVGHSDGSQLAQLAALKAADVIGADRVGGVILYGPSRVGSRGFAKYYNSLLGGKTVYYSYGRDPAANTDYTMADVSRGVCNSVGAARCLGWVGTA